MVTNINARYSTLEHFDSYPEYGDSWSKVLASKRHKATIRKVCRNDKIKAGVGSVVGTIAPMLYMAKRQNTKNIFKLQYGLKDMVILSGASVAGGVAAGMLGENKQTRKNKLNEGVFMFMNASIPAWIVAGVLKLAEGSKNFNNIPGKIMAMVGGLIISMYGSASVSNLICDPKDKLPDRKLTLADSLANIDDAIGVLVLAKMPFLEKLHAERLLPAIYSYCGYRAGKSN